jgi:GNAT superfamily N-acetyltransferase
MMNNALRVTPPVGQGPKKELSTVRTLSLQEIDMATKLFERDPDWGSFYGEKFRVEVAQAIKAPPSTLHGSFSVDGSLMAVGAVFKEPFDYAYWSLSWIFVDVDARGRGFGRQIVDSLIAHARAEQLKSHNPNCRVLLSTNSSVAAFYEKGWGFLSIHSGPLPGETLMSLDVEGPGLPMRNG